MPRCDPFDPILGDAEWTGFVAPGSASVLSHSLSSPWEVARGWQLVAEFGVSHRQSEQRAS